MKIKLKLGCLFVESHFIAMVLEGTFLFFYITHEISTTPSYYIFLNFLFDLRFNINLSLHINLVSSRR